MEGGEKRGEGGGGVGGGEVQCVFGVLVFTCGAFNELTIKIKF